MNTLANNIYSATRDSRNAKFNHLTRNKAINDKGNPVIKTKIKGAKYWIRLNSETIPVFENRGTDLSVFNQ